MENTNNVVLENENQQQVETQTTTTNNNEVEELKRQLEEAKAQIEAGKVDYAKLKKSFDVTASDVSKYKKELQAKMTEDELKKAQQEEQNLKNEQELNELKAQLQMQKATKRYLGFGLDETKANECANAEKENDIDKVLQIIKAHHEADLKSKQAEWLNGRPDPLAGGNPSEVEKDAFLRGFDM